MRGKSDEQNAFKKRIYDFTLKLIDLLDTLKRNDLVSNRLGDQLLRSGTSIIGSYIEGLSSQTKKEMIKHFNSSLKSSNESLLWICLLRDSNRFNSKQVEWFLKEIDEYAKIFASSIITMRKNNKP